MQDPAEERRETAQAQDLGTQVFNNKSFQAFWGVFLFLFLIFVSYPLRNIFLVCWVYGRDAYFHQGMRVLSVKPLKFSDGKLVPQGLDILTGFGAFAVTVFGLTLLVYASLRGYDNIRKKP